MPSQVVGEHGFTSFRSAYHAFPHHDLSTSTAREAFQRRAERMMDLVISCSSFSCKDKNHHSCGPWNWLMLVMLVGWWVLP